MIFSSSCSDLMACLSVFKMFDFGGFDTFDCFMILRDSLPAYGLDLEVEIRVDIKKPSPQIFQTLRLFGLIFIFWENYTFLAIFYAKLLGV